MPQTLHPASVSQPSRCYQRSLCTVHACKRCAWPLVCQTGTWRADPPLAQAGTWTWAPHSVCCASGDIWSLHAAGSHSTAPAGRTPSCTASSSGQSFKEVAHSCSQTTGGVRTPGTEHAHTAGVSQCSGAQQTGSGGGSADLEPDQRQHLR